MTALLPLLLCARTSAAMLVVDGVAKSASDTNPGTRALPLKTISAAVKLTKPGDTVLVRPGVYRESVQVTLSGTPDQPITLRSEVPYAAVIDGADVIPTAQFTSVSPGVYSFAAPDLPDSAGQFAPGQQVYINGEPLDPAANAAQLTPGTFFLDFAARRVLFAPLEDQDPNKIRVEYARRDGQIASNGSAVNDIHVQGFTILHNASPFGYRFGILVSGQRWVVENNHIFWSSYAGIRMEKSNHCIVRNNLIDWSGATGIGGFANINLLFENNIMRHGNWRRQDTGFDGGAGKWVFMYDSMIRGNESAFNNGFGPWFDLACGHNVYQGNVTHDSTQNAGLFAEISWNIKFLDNIAYNNEQGLMVGETSGCLLQHNICYNNQTGIYMRSDDKRLNKTEYGYQSEDSFRKLLSDNIPDIDPARLAALSDEFSTYWILPVAHPEKNNTVSENLFLDNGDAYYEWRHYGVPSAVDVDINNFSDSNLFAGTPEGSLFHYSDGAYPGLDAWRSASGRDLHSAVLDPSALPVSLPDWAKPQHTLLTQKMRSWGEISTLNLSLVKTPSAAEMNGRVLRSSLFQMVDVGDPQIKAALIIVEGQRTLAVWTTQIAARRPVRLRLGVPTVTLEDGYLRRTRVVLPDGAVSFTASYLPVYLRGVGSRIVPAPVVTLTPQAFNAPGQTVPVQAVFTNDYKTPVTLTASFLPGSGFRAVPSSVTKSLKPGAKYEATIQLQPVGTPISGPAQVRLRARLGSETITQVAAFSVGEGGGLIPFVATPPALEAGPDSWKALGDAAKLAAIGSADQIATGDKSLWKGPQDLSGQVYAAWTTNALLIGVNVIDDAVVPAAPGMNPYDADSAELFVDGRAPAFQYQNTPTGGCYHVTVSPASEKGGDPVVSLQGPSAPAGIQTAAVRTRTGYFVTVQLPLSAQNFPDGGFRAGRPVKLAVLITDKDDPKAQGRKYEIGWGISPNGSNYNDTSGWKILTLGAVH